MLKWRQNVLCEIQDGDPLTLKNNVQSAFCQACIFVIVAATDAALPCANTLHVLTKKKAAIIKAENIFFIVVDLSII